MKFTGTEGRGSKMRENRQRSQRSKEGCEKKAQRRVLEDHDLDSLSPLLPAILCLHFPAAEDTDGQRQAIK